MAAQRRKVLITGAAGRIGTAVREQWGERYQLRLFDRVPIPEAEEVITADLTDFEAVRRACEGMDAVLHLAANPSAQATFEELLGPNIIGTYNVFEAARQAGVRRMVFASTNRVVEGYGSTYVTVDLPPRPRALYDVTKIFGEALGRYYAEFHGLSTVAVRIGGFQRPEWLRARGRSAPPQWVSPRDLADLFARAIEVEGITFAIVFGLSRQGASIRDLETGRRLLGYEPQDDARELGAG
ncbi:MAG TPA: NAD(P)-dependent oxidoreductase [Armatimonadetes bacterium]|nr:NAD(P)-dependent oxidoreductase [Armatimonadota bacterium]